MTMTMTSQLVHQAIEQLETGDPRAAELTARHLLKDDPRNPELMFLLGQCLVQLVRPDEAEKMFRKAIKKKPDETRYLCGLGVALSMQGRFYPGMNAYSKALRKNELCAPAAAGLCRLYVYRGSSDRAEPTMNKFLADPTRMTGDLWTIWVRILVGYGRADEALEIINTQSNRQNNEPKSRAELKRVAANIHHTRREYDKAFSLYKAANDLVAVQYDHEDTIERFEALKSAYSKPVDQVTRGSNTITRPIFIVGMPRSGTTLVEQILNAHPEVHGAGESHDLQQVMATATEMIDREDPYPDCLPWMSVEELDSIADQIDKRFRRHSYRAERIADKTLGNIAHVGFISRVLPQATILHVRRAPMDTGFSCFTHDLSPRMHPWSSRLEDIGAYYRAYDDLMKHWESVGIRIYTVDYERLVMETEPEIRRMLDAADLPWSKSCLTSHLRTRDVFTLSYEQVRQPINHKGIGRWMLYERHLQPLREHLGDLYREPVAS